MGDKILIVDDDPHLTDIIQYNLEDEGYWVFTAGDGLAGMRSFYANSPDLVILDVNTPKLDGFEVCQRVRDMTDTPVIMLTTQGREEEIIRGLDLGADDYLAKPFGLDVLSVRVRATLRRFRTGLAPTETITYSDGYLSIDLNSRQVTVHSKMVKLNLTDYKLLALLIKNKRRLLEFRQLLEKVWGLEYVDEIDYLRVHIWHLRRKLEPDPKNPTYLINERNTGYRFEPPN